MYRLSHRYCQNRTFQLCHRQLSTHLLRNVSSTTSQRNWKNDTPAGGLTEIMVYEPDPHVSWPDPTLGIFAKSDEKFLLPGNVGGGLQCDEEIDDEDVLSLDDTKYSKVTGLVFYVHSKIVGVIYTFLPHFFYLASLVIHYKQNCMYQKAMYHCSQFRFQILENFYGLY